MNVARTRTRRAAAVGLACTVLVVVIWASFVVVSRSGARHDLLAYDLAALRLGVAGLVLLPLWWRFGRGSMSPVQTIALVALGGLLYPLFAYAGFRFAPAAHGALFLSGMLPFSTALMLSLVMHEALDRDRWIALSLLAAGVASFALDYLHAPGASERAWVGDALFICGSTSWALFAVLLKKWAVPPLAGTVNVCVGAALVYLPVYLFFLPKQIMQVELTVVLWQGIFQGVIAVAVAMLAYIRALQYLGPAGMSAATAFVPGLAALMAIPLLGEPLSWPVCLGLALVALGALYPLLKKQVQRRGSAPA